MEDLRDNSRITAELWEEQIDNAVDSAKTDDGELCGRVRAWEDNMRNLLSVGIDAAGNTERLVQAHRLFVTNFVRGTIDPRGIHGRVFRLLGGGQYNEVMRNLGMRAARPG